MSGGLESRATDFGSGSAHSGGLESEGLESGSRCSRATDFGSGSVHSGGLESGGLESGGLEALEQPISDLGLYTLGV